MFRSWPAAGRVEQDPAEVVAAAEAAIRRAADQATALGDAPEALAFAVLGEAVLPLAADGTPLARIAVSMDTRGAGLARALASTVAAERYTEITGQPLHGMFSALQDRRRARRVARGRRIPLRR